MNYQLVKNDFLPISIKTKDKSQYYNVLEEYGIKNDLNPFIEMISELEEEQLDIYINAIKLKKSNKFYNNI